MIHPTSSTKMSWGFSPLEVYTERVRKGLSDEFLYRSPVRLDQIIDLILRGNLPTPEIVDLTERLPRRRQQLAMYQTGEGLRNALLSEFPRFATRMDSFLGLEPEAWRGILAEESVRYFTNTPVREISDYLESEIRFSELREDIGRQLSKNFFIRKYKLTGVLEWRLEDLFDKLNVTNECRQIVLVKPLENKALYKLSNTFTDPASTYHSKISLVQTSSRERRVNNYIGLTLSKYKDSKDVAVVMIEEIPSAQKSKRPELRISVEIPGEKRMDDVETDGAYGTTVLKYLHDCVANPRLLAKLKAVEYSIYDLQLFTTAYDSDAIRQYLLDMSMHPILRHITFSEHKNKVDEQKFILRDLSTSDSTHGPRRVVVDIQARGVVFQASRGSDLFDVYDLISILLAYGIRKPGLNILGDVKTLNPVAVTQGSTPLTMDVVEKIGGNEFVLREAVFFDTHYADVCNKPTDKDILTGEALEEDYGFYPPESLVRKIESEGRFSFPNYNTQRVRVKLNYRTERKNYILGKRKIPKAVRDSMAARGNYAFLFDFFPCRREGTNLSPADWDGGEIFTEETKGDHILDESKDDIPPGRFGRVQHGFFDTLRSNEANMILRTGVRESPYSFLDAVIFATESQNTNFREWVRREARNRVLVEALPQFPDVSQEELLKSVNSMLDGFVESRYVIRLVEEFVKANIVVMSYVEREGTPEYALYESPHGIHPPNVFEYLARHTERPTVILLRRKYEFLPDQYDVLVEMGDDAQLTKTFRTPTVTRFLKSRITLAAVDIIHPEKLDTAALIDLSSQTPIAIPGLREVAQIIDSLGARAGSVFQANGVSYPCLYTEPTPPDPQTPLEQLNEFLLRPRPTIQDILSGGGVWASSVVAGVGITSLYSVTILSSLYMWVGSRILCVLVRPVTWDTTLRSKFSGKPLLETPDPYVGNQFKETGFRFNDILFRLDFGKTLTTMLMKVLFIEYVERVKREGVTMGSDYETWKAGLLRLVDGTNAKNVETTELRRFLYMVRDLKSLDGYYPQNPIRNLQPLEFIGKFFEGGAIRCFSRGMYDKLLSQISLLEKTVFLFEGLGGVPANIYKTDIYDSSTILSEPPGAVLVMEPDIKSPDNYRLWQMRCQTSVEDVTLFDSLPPELFETTFTLNPVLGFYGGRGTGLWSIRPPGPGRGDIPVLKTSARHGSRSDIPRIGYQSDSLQVATHEDTENTRVIFMERVL